MNRPIWFLNMCAVSDWREPRRHLSALCFWAPIMNRYFDATLVKGNPEAKAVARVCLRLFDRFADFTKLQEDFCSLKQTHRRLKGFEKVEEP